MNNRQGGDALPTLVYGVKVLIFSTGATRDYPHQITFVDLMGLVWERALSPRSDGRDLRVSYSRVINRKAYSRAVSRIPS